MLCEVRKRQTLYRYISEQQLTVIVYKCNYVIWKEVYKQNPQLRRHTK